MGRKIPGRRHRGVRDIFEQNAKRERGLANKINSPPQENDEQPIPKSLANIIELKRKVKFSVNHRKGEQIGKPKNKHLKKTDKFVPTFKKKQGESNKIFLGRVNNIVHEYLNIHKFEQKYKVDIIRDQESGEVLGVEKKPTDEIDELLKKSKKVKKNKIKSKIDDGPKLTKSQKRREKLKAKKLKKQEEQCTRDFDDYKDEIKFGEVAKAPPVFTKMPKKNKPDLAVSSKIQFESCNTGKRRNLSAPVQRMLEEERELVVAAYKKIRSNCKK
uniref:Putative coiled-coil domain-containing protein n=1 Tax=Xenopsylla cheopis TaxID=163159 RepID=A0A6M2DGD3_XENCH